MFSYKYSAVSANAVKITIFLFPELIGFVIFSSMRSLKSINFASRSGVILDDYSSKCSSFFLSNLK